MNTENTQPYITTRMMEVFGRDAFLYDKELFSRIQEDLHTTHEAADTIIHLAELTGDRIESKTNRWVYYRPGLSQNEKDIILTLLGGEDA
jgi:hypothetical protein